MKVKQKLSVILLEIRYKYWFYDLFFACRDLEIGAFEGQKIGIDDIPNPYQLPFFDKADAIFISTDWVNWIIEEKKLDIRVVLNKLRKFSNKIVGADGFDTFSVFMAPKAIDEMDFVLKAQGYYKDRELHNYETGTYYGKGDNWYEKITRRNVTYSSRQLDKLKLSLPCTININATVRRRIRKIKPNISSLSAVIRSFGDRVIKLDEIIRTPLIKPAMGVHFIGSLTHFARVRFIQILKQNNISGRYGLSGMTKYFWGSYGDTDFPNKLDEEKAIQYLKQKGYWTEPINRLFFKRTLLDYFVIAAPNGHGELTFRHAEALEAGRLLVCQDLHHVEMMFPFINGHNAVFCKPDFSDFNEIIQHIFQKNNFEKYDQIAQTGKKEWTAWIKDIDAILYEGVTKYLVETNNKPGI
ncbi:MAG TPA: hypothetical protein VK492_17525 [Chitinophagaceae bacterium]|nr:hypothetical protein [Chitinophagaceae bacterium]